MSWLIDQRPLRVVCANADGTYAVAGAHTVRRTRQEGLKADAMPLLARLKHDVATVIGTPALCPCRIRICDIVGDHVHAKAFRCKPGRRRINSQKHSHIVPSDQP